MPLGMRRGQNVGLRGFCHILPGASVFHKHMSSFFLWSDIKWLIIKDLKWILFHTVFMKPVVCLFILKSFGKFRKWIVCLWIIPELLKRGYTCKTNTDYHKYCMKSKFISDSFYHMLNLQKNKNSSFVMFHYWFYYGKCANVGVLAMTS